MQIYKGLGQLKTPLTDSYLTIGNFDGVHLGHRQLLERVVNGKGPSVVYTFDPHPAALLRPEKQVYKIFDWADQLEQLAELGTDIVIVEPFTELFSELSADEFYSDWLIKRLKPSKIVIGHDFCFGKGRLGTAAYLERKCRFDGIELEVVSACAVNSEVISSTLIRRCIESGDMKKASALLGRDFYLNGTVEHGAGRGKKIGVPTANIKTDSKLSPATGVYFGVLHFSGKNYFAVANLGRNPTFVDSGPVQLEVHIVEPVEGLDLYGAHVKFEFRERIREERKFASVEALTEQINLDIEFARKRAMS